jgi:hypothetical protein
VKGYNTKLRIKMRLNDWRSTCASITSSYKPSHFHVQLDIRDFFANLCRFAPLSRTPFFARHENFAPYAKEFRIGKISWNSLKPVTRMLDCMNCNEESGKIFMQIPCGCCRSRTLIVLFPAFLSNHSSERRSNKGIDQLRSHLQAWS